MCCVLTNRSLLLSGSLIFRTSRNYARTVAFYRPHLSFARHLASSNRSSLCFSKTMSDSVQQQKVLLAFDFDHTIIDDNSDIAVTKLAPGGVIPAEIKALYSDHGWTKFMGEIFRYLHENSTTPEEILDCMTKITFSPGMVELLTSLDKERTEIIIISDSNSIFIDHILTHHGLQGLITKVFTNPAKFNSKGRLEIEMYHVQDTCTLSTINLCKGLVLESYIEERASQNVHFANIAYVGDGQNDFCPSLRLKSSDFVFPREGHSLVKYIEKMKDDNMHIKASIHSWNSGLDILGVLHEKIPLLSGKCPEL